MGLQIVTNSELDTYRTCPARWGFRYGDRLRPLTQAWPLRIGTAWHAGLRAGLIAGHAHEGSAGGKALVAACQGIEAALLSMRLRLSIVLADERIDGDLRARLEQEAPEDEAVVEWMVSHYFKATESDFDHMVLLAAEMSFEARLPRSLVRLAGQLDAVYFDRANGDVVLDDHKSSDVLTAVEKRVEMDPQIAGYVYALRQQVELGRWAGIVPSGAQVGRVRYNVMRRKVPSQPKINKNGAVSEAACDTTAEIFEAALLQGQARGHAPSDKHLEMLSALKGRGDAFFTRLEYFRTPEQLARWQAELLVDAKRIREACRLPVMRTRSVGACTKPGSMPCEYRPVCMEPGAPEMRSAYRIAEVLHEELEGDHG